MNSIFLLPFKFGFILSYADIDPDERRIEVDTDM